MWFYLSYSSEAGFLGGAYVEGNDPRSAKIRARELAIEPTETDDILFFGPIEDALIDAIPEDKRERLLSREELGVGEALTVQGDQVKEGWL